MDEQRTLARWSGWGSLPPVFDDRDTAAAAQYADARERLRELLTESEWRAAAASTINAHYTDARLVTACWQGLRALGFTGGRVLEPGCGSGNFLGLIPDRLRDATRMVGVELEPVTAAIAARLYPDAEVRNEGFEVSRFRGGEFDAAVGNVPFGDYVLHDPVHNPARHSVHNHFLVKAVELAKPGGLVVALTSTWTLDARNPAARRDLHRRADLLGAIRLPSGAHRHAAGTDVVTDLLLLRRRLPGEQPAPFGWEYTHTIEVDGGTARVNQYFTDHPGHVLGTLGLGGAHSATTITVTPTARDPEGWLADLSDQLAGITARARRSGRGWHPDPPAPPRRILLRGTAGLEDGSLALPEGIAGPLVEVGPGGQHRPLRLANKREAAEVRALVELRDLAKLVLTTQGDPDAEPGAWVDAQARLDAAYELYRAQFGRINDARPISDGISDTAEPVVRHQPRVPRRIRRDPGWPLLAALEVVDPATGTVSKAAIFTERVISPHRSPAGADTAAGALSVCLAERGRADLAQIAHLLGVDRSTARAELGGLVWDDPATGQLIPAEQYLSGDVRGKLAAARAAAATDSRWQANVDVLTAALPPDLTQTEIAARLGATWIPRDVVTGFVRELAADPRAEVRHSPLTATWKVEPSYYGSRTVAATSQWGTGRANAYTLIDDALNQRATTVYDTTDDSRVRNDTETLAAQDKRAAIEDRFAAWVWENPDRAARLIGEYNERFNRYVLPTWDGAHLSLPGLSSAFTPHQHQRDATWRIISGGAPEGNVLLGHAVGAGKTATMIMAGVEMRRLGLVNKPLYVVPNHMLEQFGREFLQLYPNARVLLAGKDDLARGARQRFAARAATGSWDGIVITHASFSRLPLDAATEKRLLDAQVEEYRAALVQARTDRAASFTVKELQKSIKRFEERITRLSDRAKDTNAVVCFEQLGVDYLFVDEAHLFKGLPLATKLPIKPPASQRAHDLGMKLDWLRERYGRAVATFATGTPIANSLAEIWIINRYLAPGLLAQAGVEHFDAWAANFAQTVTTLELAPEGGRFRLTSRIAKFTNVPELLTGFRAFADLRTAADLNLPTPAVAGGAPATTVVPGTAALAEYIAALGRRADAIRNRAVDPTEDNMLAVSHDGRLASLDLRLVGGDQPPGTGKIAACAEHVARLYHDHAANRYRDPADPSGRTHPVPGAAHVIFCDQGTPRDGAAFTAYTELRHQLTARGVPGEKIAFIHDAAADAAKAELFRRCRDGDVAVLVGSTEKMGVGTNIQTRLLSLHHLDAPWRPADLEQRDGRILRQGNDNPQVILARYATEGSFDAYMWQTLERKARFITQITTGDAAERTVDDLDSQQVLSYAEVKALATGDPRLRQLAELDNETTRLRRLRASHDRTQHQLAGQAADQARRAQTLADRATRLQQLIAARADTSGAKFHATIDGRSYTERGPAGARLREALTAIGDHHNGRRRLGTLAGLTVYGDRSVFGEHRIWVDGHAHDPAIVKPDADTDPVGLIVRLENQARRLDQVLDEVRASREQALADASRAAGLRGQPFPHANRLASLEQRRATLSKQLETSPQPAESQPTPPTPVASAAAQTPSVHTVAAPAGRARPAHHDRPRHQPSPAPRRGLTR